MPFPMRIQPFDPYSPLASDLLAAKPPAAPKSRLKRLLGRPFPGVRRSSSAEKVSAPGDVKDNPEADPAALPVAVAGGVSGDLEPSSVCLAKMVHNFLEDNNEKPSRCGRTRCSCFNGICDSSSDDDADFFGGDAPVYSAAEILKSIAPCSSKAERNLSSDTANIVEKSKINCDLNGKRIVVDGLLALGYDASICKSRWEKSATYPSGEYEYVDVILPGGERIIVDIEFRSAFEIVRPTKRYRAALQALPLIFVGKIDRLQQIVVVVCEAAKQSLKKKGLHVPPWRKPEYIRSRWLSSYERVPKLTCSAKASSVTAVESAGKIADAIDLQLGLLDKSGEVTAEEKKSVAPVQWQPPAVQPKEPASRRARVVTGLASIF